MTRRNTESGFTLVEVAIAALITMSGLIFLASLFTLSISQNKMNTNFSTTTALAQRKLEELGAIDYQDTRITTRGGDLTTQTTASGMTFWDDVYVDTVSGTVAVGSAIPSGTLPNYRRLWRIENDPTLLNTVLISCRAVSLQSGKNNGKLEETTLMTARSF